MHTQGDATGKTTQKATRWCKCAQCATVEAGRARAAKSGMVDKAALVACGCLGDIRVITSMCLAVRHRGWVIFIFAPLQYTWHHHCDSFRVSDFTCDCPSPPSRPESDEMNACSGGCTSVEVVFVNGAASSSSVVGVRSCLVSVRASSSSVVGVRSHPKHLSLQVLLHVRIITPVTLAPRYKPRNRAMHASSFYM